MFLDNLSASVLRLCETHKLSYEAASEQCELSSRYFSDIARGKTAPTILTLEKLCIGFSQTPSDLLLSASEQQELSFRAPMKVMQIRCFRCTHGRTYAAVCPRCKVTLEREYQSFCDRCGQCLNWKEFFRAKVTLPNK